MGSSHKLRIIIAEDEPAILRYIRKVIEDAPENYEIVGTAGNGTEALQLILDNKPELVITDIRMPFMTGLELIKACKDNQIDSRFIILTGYESFEYARQAMTLGVNNYLLKPIDSEELKTCLREISEQISGEHRQKYLNWLRNMYLESGKKKAGGYLNRKKLYLFSAFFGSIGSSLYCTYHKSSEVMDRLDFSFIKEIEALYDVEIYHFTGNYQNEYVFAVILDRNRDINMDRVRGNLFEHLKNHSISVTLCSCGPVTEDQSLMESIRDIYLTVVAKLEFGRDSLLSADMDIAREIKVSEFVLQQMNSVSNMLKMDEIKRLILGCADYWEENHGTQLSIQTDLRYILQYCQKSSSIISEQLSDVSELLYDSYNYKELRCAILYELDKIFYNTDSMQPKSDRKKALTEEVKNYLDRHFTEQITFKDFNDLMGYNEKYITSVFKEQMGVSPSRYVLERRMERAKQFLEEKPDLILKEVSELVGYSDPLYFSRVFKASVGVSPSTYAKNSKEKNSK